MKPQQRSFVVEIKSARRRLKTKPKSIWGETDLKALVREAETTLPFMQNAVSNAPVSRVDQPFGPEAEKDGTDMCEAGEIQLGMMPSTGSVNMQPHQQDRAWTEHTVLKPVAGKLKPKTTGTPKRRRTSRLEKAGGRKLAPAATVAAAGVEPHSDELPLLGAENRRLKQLLAEHLTQQNAQLRTMLKRFERG